jgi:hypothetical protein
MCHDLVDDMPHSVVAADLSTPHLVAGHSNHPNLVHMTVALTANIAAVAVAIGCCCYNMAALPVRIEAGLDHRGCQGMDVRPSQCHKRAGDRHDGDDELLNN